MAEPTEGDVYGAQLAMAKASKIESAQKLVEKATKDPKVIKKLKQETGRGRGRGRGRGKKTVGGDGEVLPNADAEEVVPNADAQVAPKADAEVVPNEDTEVVPSADAQPSVPGKRIKKKVHLLRLDHQLREVLRMPNPTLGRPWIL